MIVRTGESPDWRRNGTFQLLGLDFMVNEQMEFSFIEGNPRPGQRRFDSK